MKMLVCRVCGTVLEPITRSQAIALVAARQVLEEDYSQVQQEPDISDYEHCGFCGNHHSNFEAVDHGRDPGGYIIDES